MLQVLGTCRCGYLDCHLHSVLSVMEAGHHGTSLRVRTSSQVQRTDSTCSAASGQLILRRLSIEMILAGCNLRPKSQCFVISLKGQQKPHPPNTTGGTGSIPHRVAQVPTPGLSLTVQYHVCPQTSNCTPTRQPPPYPTPAPPPPPHFRHRPHTPCAPPWPHHRCHLLPPPAAP